MAIVAGAIRLASPAALDSRATFNTLRAWQLEEDERDRLLTVSGVRFASG